MEQEHAATSRKSRQGVEDATLARATDAASRVGISIDDLTALYLLDSIKGLGPQASKALHARGVRPVEVCNDPDLLPTKGKRGEKIRDLLRGAQTQDHTELRERAVRQIFAAAKHDAKILSYANPAYPPML